MQNENYGKLSSTFEIFSQYNSILVLTVLNFENMKVI